MVRHDPQKMPTNFSTSVQFSLKTPKHGRATFSVIKRVVDRETLRSKNEVLKLPQIEAINRDYQSKRLPYEVCLQLAKEVVQNQYKELGRLGGRTEHMSENRELLEKYWEARGKNKDISSPKASKNRLKRAVDRAGDLSLRSARIEDIQKQINSKVRGNRQRDTVAVIHQIFQFIGRTDRLQRDRPEVRYVRSLKEGEVQALYPHLTEEQRLVFQVAFATGCRLGEIFALDFDEYRQGQLGVKMQMDETGVLRETKTRQIRTTVVLPGYEDVVLQWLKTPIEERRKIRNLPWSKICRKACVAAKLRKICVFHDLRHSFAVHIRDHGGSKDDIADALGNSVAMVEKHYVGRLGTSQSLNNLLRVLKH
jgi:integrase